MNPAPKIKIDFLSDVNEKFYPLLGNRSRYLVLWGGGSSGKSRFAAQKIVARLLSERGHRILCLRQVARTLRESVLAEFKAVIKAWGVGHLFKVPAGVASEMYIACPSTGGEILFSGADDVEKLKSIVDITGIWIEEASEVTLEDFQQLDIRMRGQTPHYRQIILTFNPVSPTLWLKDQLVDSGRADMTALHSTHRDNRFLDEASRQVLESFRETDPYYYSVYCEGAWGVLGKTLFDAQAVNDRLIFLRDVKPVRCGLFECEYRDERIFDTSIRWTDERGGYVRIYEDVLPGHPYVIGGDTAGEGSDFFVGQVIDNSTGKQVACLRHQFDEDIYARQMYCLGKHYNNALIGIETNFSTYPVKELERLRYTHMFVREIEDTYTHKLTKTFGFKTTKLTRPLVISGLVEIVREHVELLNDKGTLEEMLTFVRNAKGRPEAQGGKTDDLIMGLAIAYYVRGQQSTLVQGTFRGQRSAKRSKLSLWTGW